MFSSMTSSVTNWFGNSAGGEENEKEKEKSENKPESDNADVKDKVGQQCQTQRDEVTQDKETESVESAGEKSKEAKAEDSKEEKTEESMNIDFDEVSAKAINTAKEWGSYLYTFGKAATEQVSKTAKQFKDVVEEKTILGDFAKEQEKFVHDKRERAKLSEAAVPPWVGYNEEEAMRQQIMALSQDRRNFLRNPPTGVQFQFDFEASYPVALATLPEDPNLKEMRFELVPKLVSEENFWRNYFYRVSLIKQSTQLTTLAQQSGSTGESSSSSRRSSTGTENGNKEAKTVKHEPEELPTGSPPDHEFVSDAFQGNQINEDDLKKEMEQLGMNEQKVEESDKKPAAEDMPDWEKELQAELQEYEVVDDGKAFDDDELDEEILQEIEQEANMK